MPTTRRRKARQQARKRGASSEQSSADENPDDAVDADAVSETVPTYTARESDLLERLRFAEQRAESYRSRLLAEAVDPEVSFVDRGLSVGASRAPEPSLTELATSGRTGVFDLRGGPSPCVITRESPAVGRMTSAPSTASVVAVDATRRPLVSELPFASVSDVAMGWRREGISEHANATEPISTSISQSYGSARGGPADWSHLGSARVSRPDSSIVEDRFGSRPQVSCDSNVLDPGGQLQSDRDYARKLQLELDAERLKSSKTDLSGQGKEPEVTPGLVEKMLQAMLAAVGRKPVEHVVPGVSPVVPVEVTTPALGASVVLPVEQTAASTDPMLAMMQSFCGKGGGVSTKVPDYDGVNMPLETFVTKFEASAKFHRWNAEARAYYLTNALSGQAAQVLWPLPPERTEGQVLQALRLHFGNENRREEYRDRLFAMKQKPGMSLQDLHNEICKLTALAYPMDKGDMLDSFGLMNFFSAMSDVELSCRVRDTGPKTLAAALSKALAMETYRKPSIPIEQPEDRKKVRTVQVDAEQEKQLKQMTKERDDALKSVHYWRGRASGPAPGEKGGKSAGPQTNTYTEEAPVWRERQQSSGRGRGRGRGRGNSNGTERTTGCFECGEEGHYKRDCPRRVQDPVSTTPAAVPVPAPSSTVPASTAEVRLVGVETVGLGGRTACPVATSLVPSGQVGVFSLDSKECVYLPVKVKSRKCNALLDTGSLKCIMPLKDMPKAELRPSLVRLYSASGQQINVLGSVVLPVTVVGQRFNVEFIVSDAIEEIILGLEFMQASYCRWDVANSEVCIMGKTVKLVKKAGTFGVRRVYVRGTVSVPGNSTALVPVKMTYQRAIVPLSEEHRREIESRSAQADWLMESKTLKAKEVFTAHALLPECDAFASVSVLNLRERAYILYGDSCVGNACEAVCVTSITDDCTRERETHAQRRESERVHMPDIKTVAVVIDGVFRFSESSDQPASANASSASAPVTHSGSVDFPVHCMETLVKSVDCNPIEQNSTVGVLPVCAEQQATFLTVESAIVDVDNVAVIPETQREGNLVAVVQSNVASSREERRRNCDLHGSCRTRTCVCNGNCVLQPGSIRCLGCGCVYGETKQGEGLGRGFCASETSAAGSHGSTVACMSYARGVHVDTHGDVSTTRPLQQLEPLAPQLSAVLGRRSLLESAAEVGTAVSLPEHNSNCRLVLDNSRVNASVECLSLLSDVMSVYRSDTCGQSLPRDSCVRRTALESSGEVALDQRVVAPISPTLETGEVCTTEQFAAAEAVVQQLGENLPDVARLVAVVSVESVGERSEEDARSLDRRHFVGDSLLDVNCDSNRRVVCSTRSVRVVYAPEVDSAPCPVSAPVVYLPAHNASSSNTIGKTKKKRKRRCRVKTARTIDTECSSASCSSLLSSSLTENFPVCDYGVCPAFVSGGREACAAGEGADCGAFAPMSSGPCASASTSSLSARAGRPASVVRRSGCGEEPPGDPARIHASCAVRVPERDGEFDHLVPIIESLPVDVDIVEKDRIVSLLKSYGDTFSKSEFDLGCTHLLEAKMDVGAARPHAEPLRRHAKANLDQIDAEVDKLLEADVIEPSSSEWNFNLVVVQKRETGKIRITTDLRKLNEKSYRDMHPLPRCSDCLDSLAGKVWFSCLDISQSFHQVPLAEESRNYTSFSTRRGSFRYKRMPMGWVNSPSVFSRLMNLVLRGVCFINCLAYLDDLIVYGRDYDEHYANLQIVLQRLREAGLKLKPNKCRVLRRSIQFLGFNVSADGLSTCDDKVARVRNWTFPTTVTELKSFMGLASYYRQFVVGFAHIAAPLTDMQKRDTVVEPTPAALEAFEKLKVCLTTAPILALPIEDEGATYVLDTDASDVAAGAVLSQWQSGKLRVIAYASRCFTAPERNYCVTRRELTAFLYGLFTFRVYLLQRDIVVRTDHMALKFLMSAREPIGQAARYLDFISQFRITIEHRPGARHGNADALSRFKPCDSGEPGFVCKNCNRFITGKGAGEVETIESDESCENTDLKQIERGEVRTLMSDASTWRCADEKYEEYEKYVKSSDSEDDQFESAVMVRPLRVAGPPSLEAETESDEVQRPYNLRSKRSSKSKNTASVRLPDLPVELCDWSLEYVAKCQRDDVDIKPVFDWFEATELPRWDTVKGSSPFSRALYRQFDSLCLKNDVLCRTFADTAGQPLYYQIVLPRVLVNAFVDVIHCDSAGHLKFEKCVQLVKAKAWWYTYRNDLQLAVASCDKCNSFTRSRPPKQGRLRPTVVGGPCERWAIDLMGNFPASNGYTYIFTAIDVFTKFLVAVPIRNKTAESVANVLVKHVILQYGMPFEILSDLGKEFQNEILQETMRILNIRGLRTTAYTPNSNGIVERVHRTLNCMIAKCISETQRDWSYYIDYVRFSYNSTPVKSTGLSPFYVTYGRDPRWRIDFVLQSESEPEYVSVPAYTRDVVERMRYAHELARKNLGVAGKYMSDWFDRDVKLVTFQIGEHVRVLNMRRYKGRTPKWQLQYGPTAVVMKCLNESTYVVKLDKSRKEIVVHVNKLKKLVIRPDVAE